MRLILTLIAAVALGTAGLGSTAAFAQDASKKPATKTNAAQKKPGKTCGDLASNSQAHKDCIAKNAHTQKSAKTTKAPKMKAEKTPKKTS
jgi:hypothetical protein